MRTFIKTKQDTTIYQRFPTFNTGLDEILEVGKVVKDTDGSNTYASSSARILLMFDGITQGAYTSSAEYYLNLYLADAKNINRYQRIEVCPISSSWIEGSGYSYQNVRNVSDGATWNIANVVYDTLTTWSVAGGDFTTAVTASYQFSDIPLTSNVRINITNLISPIISGTNVVPWNGLMVKFPTADETNQNNIGNMKFFSGNTHTVFEPNIEVVWSSQIFNTGSLKPLPNSNVMISPKNIKESYIQGEVDKIYLIVRDRYPDKKFDSVQRYKNTYYLPSESYFRIRDEVSDVELYRFDAFSAVNCDPTGSYITLDTRGLNIGRYYSIDLKVNSGNLVFFPDFKYTFKVENND